jgi:RPA family protein
MAEQEIKRQTAYKCTIATLNKGVFVKKQGWESNYLMTEYGDFSRVNIIAVVVGKDDNNSIILDDGTGQINGKLFERVEQLDSIIVGSLVLIIGRPREFNNKIYLTIEIVKSVTPGWIAYRKKELTLLKRIRESEDLPKEKKTLEPEIIESSGTLSSKEKITKLIKDLDRGDGASIDDVMRLSRVVNGEELISDMMMRGEIYESKAGHIKTM